MLISVNHLLVGKAPPFDTACYLLQNKSLQVYNVFRLKMAVLTTAMLWYYMTSQSLLLFLYQMPALLTRYFKSSIKVWS